MDINIDLRPTMIVSTGITQVVQSDGFTCSGTGFRVMGCASLSESRKIYQGKIALVMVSRLRRSY